MFSITYWEIGLELKVFFAFRRKQEQGGGGSANINFSSPLPVPMTNTGLSKTNSSAQSFSLQSRGSKQSQLRGLCSGNDSSVATGCQEDLFLGDRSAPPKTNASMQIENSKRSPWKGIALLLICLLLVCESTGSWSALGAVCSRS